MEQFLISKEDFICCMNFIKDQDRKQSIFINALETLSPGSYCDCFVFGEYEYEYIKLLEKLTYDVNHDISYFLYDYHKGKIEPLDSEGNVLYSDFSSLYDYLLKQYLEKNK